MYVTHKLTEKKNWCYQYHCKGCPVRPSSFTKQVLETFLIDQLNIVGTAVKHKDEIVQAHMGGQVGKTLFANCQSKG